MTNRYLTAVAALALLTISADVAGAQPPISSARSLGLANSYSARARGYEAAAWNPANLALPDMPKWSLGVIGVSAYVNNNSLSYGQITDLYGSFIDEATKEALLADIRRDDPDRMLDLSVDVGASALSASIWRFAVGFGVVGAGDARVSPDALELILYGNVGQDGSGKDFDLEGSEGEGWALSHISVSYAQPFTIPAVDGMTLSVGAGAKYGIAHALARVLDRGSVLTFEPLAGSIDVEVLNSTDADLGRWWSLDLGVAVDWRKLTAGIALQNAFGNIGWNADDFELQVVNATADFQSTSSADTTIAFVDMSPDEQARVSDFLDRADVPTRLRLGGLYRFSPIFTLSADYEQLLDGTLRTRWNQVLSLGGELMPFKILPLRAGLATDFSALAITGGLGIYAGPLHIDGAIGSWAVTGGGGTVASLSISVWP